MRALSLLIKPASSGCNMRCGYCFYADISSARAVKNYGVMSFEALEVLVRKALAETKRDCHFGFQGGEPLLAGLEFYERFVELEERYNVNKVRIHHAMQTNGLLIDEKWAEFLHINRFLIGLSIDGEKQTHDSLRPDALGGGTHSRCMAAAKTLDIYGVDFNILSVVTRDFAAHPAKAYNFYKKNGFRHIQFIPCLDGFTGEPKFSPDAGRYGNFLCAVFDLWYSDLTKGVYCSIRSFDNYVHMLNGQPPENCAMSGVYTPHPVIEADGSVYPCDFYATDEFRLGNILEDDFGKMLTSGKAKDFVALSHEESPACGACEYFFICRGGCQRERVEGSSKLNRFCAAYKKFFAYALPRLRMIARRRYVSD